MQIIATLRVAKMKNTDNGKCWWGMEWLEHSRTIDESVNWHTITLGVSVK